MTSSWSFQSQILTAEEASKLPLKKLAHLGDAVFSLFERENEILSSSNIRQMHERMAKRGSAIVQSELLLKILPELNDLEQDLVRRARNIKAPSGKPGGQAKYRQATAFEVLLGFLYLTSPERLKYILARTI